jgi:hypothetical protein
MSTENSNPTVNLSSKKGKTKLQSPVEEAVVINSEPSVVLESKKTNYEKSDSLPKSSWLWIKDSTGTPSVSATFATVAFWVTTLAYVLSIIETYGQITFRQFDVAACSAYLIPILTLYFSRRWSTDRLNIIQNQNNNSKNSGETNNE